MTLPRLAVVGVGIVGSQLVRRLAATGHDVAVYDIRREAAAAVAAVATVAASAAEAADGRDLVIVTVLDDEQVLACLEGGTGILDAATVPKAIAIMSTVTPTTIREAHGAAVARGSGLIDCAISGVAGSEHGVAAVLVGGDEETFAATRTVFEAFTWKVIHMGSLGSGMNAKLAKAVITFGRYFVAAEAARLAAASGIDVEKLLDAMVGGARFTFDVNEFLDGLAAASGRENSGLFPAEIWKRLPAYAHKDLGDVLELADLVGVDLPLTRFVDQHFEDAVDVSRLRPTGSSPRL